MNIRTALLVMISALTIAQTAQALSQFDCRAQMVAAANSKNTPIGLFAPSLVFRRQDALKDAKANEKSLTLRFNTNSLNSHQSPVIILDGRTKNLQMNTHITVKKSADMGVRVDIEDRVSGEKSLNLFRIVDSGKSLRLRTNAGSLILTCFIK